MLGTRQISNRRRTRVSRNKVHFRQRKTSPIARDIPRNIYKVNILLVNGQEPSTTSSTIFTMITNPYSKFFTVRGMLNDNVIKFTTGLITNITQNSYISLLHVLYDQNGTFRMLLQGHIMETCRPNGHAKDFRWDEAGNSQGKCFFFDIGIGIDVMQSDVAFRICFVEWTIKRFW